MSRSLKPLKVDSYWHNKSRTTVEIMLDRNEKTFFAMVQLEKIEAASARECVDLVRKKLDSWQPPEWSRVIELEVEPTPEFHHGGKVDQHHEGLRFTFERKEIAKTLNGKWMERPFREDYVKHDGPDWLAEDYDKGAATQQAHEWELEKQIPYSEEAWATLVSLQEAMQRARAKLEEIFDPKDKGRRLIALGGLPAIPLLGASTAVVQPAKASRR